MHEPLLTTLAERVAHARALAHTDECRLSNRELDRIAGLHHGHSRAIEDGKRTNPEYETTRKLAAALGARVGWLLEGEGAPPSAEDVRLAVARARAAAGAPSLAKAG